MFRRLLNVRPITASHALLWRRVAVRSRLTTSFSMLAQASVGTGVAYLLYAIYRTNVKQPVYDETIKSSSHEIHDDLPSGFIDGSRLVSCGDVVIQGRSNAEKVYLENEEGERTFYYHKTTFSRAMLLDELIVGRLGKMLMHSDYPDVYAVQNTFAEDATRSQFSFLSQSLSDSVHNDNLEAWCLNYSHDEEEYIFGPRHLGLAVAFDMMLGKSDIKLANLVVIRGTKGRCYSIDHESAFSNEIAFVESGQQAMRYIGEFSGKSFTDMMHEHQSDGMLNTVENPNQPLKDKPHLKAKVGPILCDAIQADVDNGKIHALYERFSSLNREQLETLFTPFAGFIREDEKVAMIARLERAQAATAKYLQEGHIEEKETGMQRVSSYLGVRR